MSDIIHILAPEPVEPDPRWAADTLRRVTSSRAPRRHGRFWVAGVAVVFALGGGAAAVANHGSDAKFSRTNPANARAYQELDAASDLRGPKGVGGRISETDDTALTAAPWVTNEYGLSVGEPTQADVLLHNLPDLMPTFILDGETRKIGYFRSDEFYIFAPNGELKNSPDRHNVYGPDGQTLLGAR